LTVVATGTPPLAYQWRLNQSAILDATNSSLVLTNLGSADGGAYSVAVSNAYGSTNSSDAVLVVDDSGSPSLTVERNGTNLVVSWFRSCVNYQLEENQTLNPANWSPVSTPVQDSGPQRTATIPIANGIRFYRLRN
jgi:hypothetical protein